MQLRQRPLTALLGLATLLLAGCPSSSSNPITTGSGGGSSTPALGGPIDGLTPEELAAFNRGKEVFERRFRPSEGLGPFYNATSCASCHSTPVSGGSSGLYRNFYLAVYGTLQSQGAIPPFLSPVVPAYGTGGLHSAATEFSLEGGRPPIPDTVFNLPVRSAQRNTPPIFGVGLFEFVSDVEILSRADPFDSDGDGISGRHNIDAGAVGRLGFKAQSNNSELFVRAPLQNQMGITSDPFEGEDATVSLVRAAMQASADPNDPTTDADPVPDPEITRDDLGDLIAFTRFLAPPMPKPFDAEATRGEELFEQTGCTKCHVPSLPSSRGPVNAHTDLLLHFMGFDLADEIKLGDNGTTSLEFRTQPLWGVSNTAPFLHDGRAETLHEAIDFHGGEALGARNGYLALDQVDRDAIIHFLEHL